MNTLNEKEAIIKIALELDKNINNINKAIEECQSILAIDQIASSFQLSQIFNSRLKHLTVERNNARSDLAKIKNFATSNNFEIPFEQVEQKEEQTKEEIPVKQMKVNNLRPRRQPTKEILDSLQEEMPKVEEPIIRKEPIMENAVEESIPNFETTSNNNVEEMSETEAINQEPVIDSNLTEETKQAMAEFEDMYKDSFVSENEKEIENSVIEEGITENQNDVMGNFASTYGAKFVSKYNQQKSEPIMTNDSVEEAKQAMAEFESMYGNDLHEDNIDNVSQELVESNLTKDVIDAMTEFEGMYGNDTKEESIDNHKEINELENTYNEIDSDIQKASEESKIITNKEIPEFKKREEKEPSDPNNVIIKNFACTYKDGRYLLEFDASKNGVSSHIKKGINLSKKRLKDESTREFEARKYNVDLDSDFYKKMDLNLLKILSTMDKGVGTNFVDAYKNGTLGDIATIMYDCRGQKLETKDRIKQYTIARKQKDLMNKAIVIKPNGNLFEKTQKQEKNEKVENNIRTNKTPEKKNFINKEKYLKYRTAAAAIAVAAVIGVSSVVPALRKKHDTKTAENKTYVETQAVTDGLLVATKAFENIDSIIDETIKKENKKSSESTLTVGSAIRLVHKDDDGNFINACQLRKDINDKDNKLDISEYKDYDRFVISSINVFKGNEKIRSIITNDIGTMDLYEAYGKDIDIIFGFDAYKDGKSTPEIKNIGYITEKDIHYDSKIDEEGKEIAKEEQDNDKYSNYVTLEDLDSYSSTTESTEKVNTKEEEKEQSTEAIQKEKETKQEVLQTEINSTDYDFGLNGKVNLAIKDKSGKVTSSKTLTSNAWGEGKKGSAGSLDCDYFKVGYIAVYSGDDVIDVIKVKNNSNVNDILNNQYKRHGANIGISLNFDGYEENKSNPTYERAGWVSIDEVSSITQKDKEQLANKNDNKDLASKEKVYRK